mgnify:CR=1 FL=1
MEPRRITSLDQLDTIALVCEIVRDDGSIAAFEFEQPQYSESVMLHYEDEDPAADIIGADTHGKPIYDFNSPIYRKAQQDVALRRAMRLVIRYIKLALPGDTFDEKRAALERALSYAEIDQLIMFMNAIMAKREAKRDQLAERFQSNGRAPDANRAGAPNRKARRAQAAGN